MTKGTSPDFEYRTDGVNASFGILLIRVSVGLPIALVVGFVGNMLNGMIVPSPAAGDDFAFLVRMLVIGATTAAGGMVAWFNVYESKSGGFALWALSTIGGLIGAIIGYFVGSSFIDHPDVYILNQRLTQVVILGSGLGATMFAVVISIVSTRFAK